MISNPHYMLGRIRAILTIAQESPRSMSPERAIDRQREIFAEYDAALEAEKFVAPDDNDLARARQGVPTCYCNPGKPHTCKKGEL